MQDKIKDLFSNKETKEFANRQEKFTREDCPINKIKNILIIGIGTYCNEAISKINKQGNITKMYADTDRKQFKKYFGYPILDLSKENINENNLWKTNDDYKKIYDEVSKYQIYFTNYNYVVICTAQDNKEYNLIAKVIADFCRQQDKKFMVCYAKEAFLKNTDSFAKEIENNAIRMLGV